MEESLFSLRIFDVDGLMAGRTDLQKTISGGEKREGVSWRMRSSLGWNGWWAAAARHRDRRNIMTGKPLQFLF
jgi:hypothetical protein